MPDSDNKNASFESGFFYLTEPEGTWLVGEEATSMFQFEMLVPKESVHSIEDPKRQLNFGREAIVQPIAVYGFSISD